MIRMPQFRCKHGDLMRVDLLELDAIHGFGTATAVGENDGNWMNMRLFQWLENGWFETQKVFSCQKRPHITPQRFGAEDERLRV